MKLSYVENWEVEVEMVFHPSRKEGAYTVWLIDTLMPALLYCKGMFWKSWFGKSCFVWHISGPKKKIFYFSALFEISLYFGIYIGLAWTVCVKISFSLLYSAL